MLHYWLWWRRRLNLWSLVSGAEKRKIEFTLFIGNLLLYNVSIDWLLRSANHINQDVGQNLKKVDFLKRDIGFSAQNILSWAIVFVGSKFVDKRMSKSYQSYLILRYKISIRYLYCSTNLIYSFCIWIFLMMIDSSFLDSLIVLEILIAFL